MTDNVAVTAGAGTTIAADEVTDGTLGSVKVQIVKLMDGTLDGTAKVAAGAKGVQGAGALQTQDFKDTGRVPITLLVDEFQSSATAETLITTLSISKAFAAPTTGQSSYTVTAAKTFRVQSISIQITTTTGNTTAVKCYVRVRVNASGAAIVSSPVVYEAAFSSSSTALGATSINGPSIPDGLEILAGAGIGVTIQIPSWVVTSAAPLVIVTIIGFEY